MTYRNRTLSSVFSTLLTFVLLFGSNLVAAQLRLGVQVADSTSPAGAMVFDLSRVSAAQRAGIRPGDVITQIGPVTVNGAQALINQTSQLPGNESVEITFVRDYEEMSTRVELLPDQAVQQLPPRSDWGKLVLVRPSRLTSMAVETGFWINGVYIGHMSSGIIEIDVPPGDHYVKAMPVKCGSCWGECQVCQQGVEPPTFNAYWVVPDFKGAIGKGETVYLEYVVSATQSAVGRTRHFLLHDSMPATANGLSRVGVPEVNAMQVYQMAHIPRDELAVFDNCMAGVDAACSDYRQRFSDPAMLAMLDQSGGVKGPQRKERNDKAKQAARKALMANIPPAAQRDAMMVRISALLKEGKPADALPIFEELQELPVVLDPDLGYFWGKALIDARRKDEGVERLYTYVSVKGRQAAYYRDALKLINTVEYGL